MPARDAVWKDVNKAHPCIVCGKTSRCQMTADGAIRCFKKLDPPPGFQVIKTCTDGTKVFRRISPDVGSPQSPGSTAFAADLADGSFKPDQTERLTVVTARLEAALDDKRCMDFADW